MFYFLSFVLRDLVIELRFGWFLMRYIFESIVECFVGCIIWDVNDRLVMDFFVFFVYGND